MKISNDFPPNYRQIADTLGIDTTAVYCYGDTIYNPHNREITPDIEIHEAVHSKQQGSDPSSWCARYLVDRAFRQECEVEAYSAQYGFALEHVKDRKITDWLLEKLADELSSPCYNLDINQKQAASKIRNGAKI